jgi:ferric-dicitrate binding protein FerR (iron transport regulator)
MKTACILLTTLLLAVGVSAVSAAPVKAVVKTVEGTVEFAPAGSGHFEQLTVGQELEVGATIRTGENSSADIITTPGAALHVGAESNLKITALDFSTGSDGKVNKRQTHLKLESGVISALIDPSTPKATDFSVQTPDGSAAARGTFYGVMVSHGHTYVTVDRGKIAAMADSKKRAHHGFE